MEVEVPNNSPNVKELINKLQLRFREKLDHAVLQAILEMHNYNLQESEEFLKDNGNQNGGNEDLHYYNANHLNGNSEVVPRDYFALPSDFIPVEKVTVDEEVSLKNLFMRQSTFEEHYHAQKTKLQEYIATVICLMSAGLEIKDSSKARMLASLWSLKKYQIAAYFLKSSHFGLTEVLKAVLLLDSNRKIRVLEKKLTRLQKLPKVKPSTMGKIQSSINDLKRETIQGSLSGALIRHIREWVKDIPEESLTFYILNFPKEPWQELSDLLHLNPKDFKDPSFLHLVYGKPAPEGSALNEFNSINSDNIRDIIQKHHIPYSVLRKKNLIVDSIKPLIASYTPLETLIWFYEELSCPEVDQLIQEKLTSGERLKMGYGKLMERLLTFKGMNVPFYQDLVNPAEEKLKKTKLPLEPPVVCIGDASYSMDVAIRVSTIITSLFAALTEADLIFFNGNAMVPPKVPRTINDVIDVAQQVKADGFTAPAASIFEYYRKQIQVKTFVLVTDEVENQTFEGYFFAQLFYKYRKEVYPSQIIVVSFSEQSGKGRMVKALELMGITPFLELRLDANRPDLTKLDSMLATMSSHSSTFSEIVDRMTDRIAQGDETTAISQALSSIVC